VAKEIDIIRELAEVASKYPYYKYGDRIILSLSTVPEEIDKLMLAYTRYNQKWEWCMEKVLCTILFCGYLGSTFLPSLPGSLGRLLTPQDVSEILQGKPIKNGLCRLPLCLYMCVSLH